ncbi:C39 family peptidase [Paenibacillus glucanolyticus]|uniref:C39 family peptidase n=1 Tax=Paenibacillus glucanolyticus TaxID=59843 RepID=UPI0036A7F91F
MKQSNIIDHIQPFNDLFYRVCFYNSLFPLLNSNEGSCLSFLVNDVSVYHGEIVNDLPKLEVQYRSNFSLEQLLELHGIDHYKKQISNDIECDVMEDIDRGRPVIVWVDCFYEKIRNDTYMKKHLSHTWLIHGYNKDERMVHIIEHKYSDSLTYEKRVVGFSDLNNCYDGYIIHNKQTCGFPRFYECQSECGFYHSQDYHTRCGFPKYHNFANKSEIASYISFDLQNKHNRYFTQERCKDIYLTQIALNLEFIWDGLAVLRQYLGWLKEIFMNEEKLRIHCEEIVTDLNNIVNSKHADKYKNEHLFGKESALYAKANDLARAYSTVRSVVTKFMYSQIYDRQKMESLFSYLDDLPGMENDYYSETRLQLGFV